MEYIRVACAKCGRKLKAPASAAGKKAVCPNCKQTLSIPPAPAPQEEQQPEHVNEEPIHQQDQCAIPYAEAPYQQAPPKQQIQQVIIQQLTTHSNSLGIASIVLGVLGLLICWIPFINILGIPLSALGLLLGGIGLFLIITHKGSGLGFSIAGGAISALALTVAILISAAVFGTMGEERTEEAAPSAFGTVGEESTEEAAPPAFVPQPLAVEKLTDREQEAYRRLVEKRIMAASKSELISYFGDRDPMLRMAFIYYDVSKMKLLRKYSFDLWLKGATDDVKEAWLGIPLDCEDVPGTIRIIERFAPELINHRRLSKAPPSWYGTK